MKDEVKEKYERNNPPLSENKYAEQSGQGYSGYHGVVPFMSKEADLQLRAKNLETS
jgi:hypothetical protein